MLSSAPLFHLPDPSPVPCCLCTVQRLPLQRLGYSFEDRRILSLGSSLCEKGRKGKVDASQVLKSQNHQTASH